MSKTIRDGYELSSSPADGIHTHAGVLRGFLISSTSTSNLAVVTFYDNTTATGTVLLVVNVYWQASPTYIMFPREHAPRFSTGLSATFTYSNVAVWSVDFG